MKRNEVAQYMDETLQKQESMQSDDLLKVWRQLSEGLSQALRMATLPECVCVFLLYLCVSVLRRKDGESWKYDSIYCTYQTLKLQIPEGS